MTIVARGDSTLPDNRKDDVELVTEMYELCWQRSKARYNSWVDGRLHPQARRFYIVANATERSMMDGITSVLKDPRFSLAETAEAFAFFGLARLATVMRDLNALVDDQRLSRDPRERDLQLMDLMTGPSKVRAETDRLHDQFPVSQEGENEIWHVLANWVREHPEAFAATGDTR